MKPYTDSHYASLHISRLYGTRYVRKSTCTAAPRGYRFIAILLFEEHLDFMAVFTKGTDHVGLVLDR